MAINKVTKKATAASTKKQTKAVAKKASGISQGLARGRKIFPFLSLPRELRDKIYALVFPSHRGFVRFFHKQYPMSGNIVPANVKINLLFTCRQIYNEGLPILYKVNTFCITPLIPAAYEFEQYRRTEVQEPTLNSYWLAAMPKAGRDNITTLEIRLPSIDFDNAPLTSYADMSKMFPALKQLTLFADSTFLGGFSSFLDQKSDLTDCQLFYQRLKALLPSAPQVFLDLYFVRHAASRGGRDASMIQIIKNVFSGDGNADEAPSATNAEMETQPKSLFVKQEDDWEDKYYEQERKITEYLKHNYGEGAEDWNIDEIGGWWGLRGEGVMDGDDNDSVQELHFFDERMIKVRAEGIADMMLGRF